MLEKIFIDTFPGFISLRDANHKILYLNKNFSNWIAKYTAVDPLGKTNLELAELVPENVASVFLQCHDGSLDLEKAIPSNEGLKKVIKFDNEDRSEEAAQYFDVFKYRVIMNDKPHIFTVAYDITNLYKENQNNLFSALTDWMTGAFNRRYLIENHSIFFGHHIAVIDLDNFKMINDFEGHHVGDRILKEFVQFAKKYIPGVSTVIRLGGDEFLVIFSNGFEEKELLERLENSRKLFEEVYSKYRYLSYSYGLGVIGHSIDEALIDLDKKMYKDKLERKSRKLNQK